MGASWREGAGTAGKMECPVLMTRKIINGLPSRNTEETAGLAAAGGRCERGRVSLSKALAETAPASLASRQRLPLFWTWSPSQ